MDAGATKNRKLRKTYSTSSKNIILGFVLLTIFHVPAFAQVVTPKAESSSVISNPLFIALLCVIILLLVVIKVFADIVKAAARHRAEQDKSKGDYFSNTAKTFLVLLLTGASSSLFAQANNVPAVAAGPISYGGLDAPTFYMMLGIIVFEVLIIGVLYRISMQLLRVKEQEQERAKAKAEIARKRPSLIEKINASVAVEEEADIMLDHNYDGIRELDNNLPPWWKYGFYVTIVFAAVYLIHYHVTKTGKLQLAEYENELVEAKLEIDEYKKRAGNLVDETNATMLTDEASLSSGKTIFMDNCAACHGRGGEGTVGPNLTDDYWIHKGGIKDIFKTIKYGMPEKGMKSWQQDLGAKQILEVASYIKTLRGTNPPNGKPQQGDLYTEEIKSDSIKVMASDSMMMSTEAK